MPVIERVVETLAKVDKKQSYFVERDGTRLVLKRFDRGKGPYTSYLRSTALPFGTYEVVGSDVVHRYNTDAIFHEVTRAQQLERMKSPAFVDAVKQLAKKVGAGKPTKLVTDPATGPATWIGYQLELARPASPNLEKLCAEFAQHALVVFGMDEGELGVVCGDQVDALTLWYGEQLRPLFALIDEQCGIAAIEEIRYRSLLLRLAHAPNKPAVVTRALAAEITEGEGAISEAEWRKQLAERRLLLWWDS